MALFVVVQWFSYQVCSVSNQEEVFFLALSLSGLACLLRIKLCFWLRKALCRIKFIRRSLGPVQFSYTVTQLRTATQVILQQEFKQASVCTDDVFLLDQQ